MIWLNILIIAIILTGFFAAALGLKLFFAKDAAIAGQSCHVDERVTDNTCSLCNIKEIVDCKEKTKK